MNFKLLNIFLSLYLIGSIKCAQCPQAEVITPCKCLNSEIKCDIAQIINLKKIFRAMTIALKDQNKDFKSFQMTNNLITDLEENTFDEIRFENIKILANNLSSIHIRAFETTNMIIKSFTLINTSLTSKDSDHDPFYMISSMYLLEELDISNSQLSEIPKDAFKPLNGQQTKLTTINLANNQIYKIGVNAFYFLPSLKELNLSGNLIEDIEENAFNLEKTSNFMLSIDLSNNKLDSKSFTVGIFGSLNRPTTLNFDGNTDLNYLDRQVFKSFLDINTKDQIQLNELDCKNCKSFWLVEYTQRLNLIKCSDKLAFMDDKHFQPCHKESSNI